MSLRRTPLFDQDLEFEYDGQVTKSYVDQKTGKRYVVGVASGVEVDHDGERVSKGCIEKMAVQATRGGVKLTSSHSQDWMTEIGDVTKAQYDPESGEFVVESVLPPEGQDPIADKGWRALHDGGRMGFSIGGKLRKARYEMNEVGKRRKVLEEVDLRHLMLTKKPAYQHSFAEAVAKSMSDDGCAEGDFTEDVPADELVAETVSKAAETATPTQQSSSMSGDRNAGEHQDKAPAKDADDPGKDEDAPAKGDPPVRRLACPNCGHEFAAGMPEDFGNDNPEDLDVAGGESDDTDKKTAKSVEEIPVSSLTDTLDTLKALVDEADKPAEVEVEKTATDDELPDVAKMLAASHKATTDRQDALETQLGTAFEVIAKSIQKLDERIQSLPRGRKSVARILPPRSETDDVEKTLTDDEVVAKADGPIEAIKALNERTYGIR